MYSNIYNIINYSNTTNMAASTPKHIEYHPHNPLSHTDHELDGTGPEHCENCRHHGTDSDGFWRGYCLNCAYYEYKFVYGFGYSDGKEQNYDDYITSSVLHTEIYKSMLKNIISWDVYCGYNISTTSSSVVASENLYTGTPQENYDAGSMGAEYYAYSQDTGQDTGQGTAYSANVMNEYSISDIEDSTSEDFCDSP